jgi:predicted enzyme involved in methoxymalonyl-ACP biosynthesis
MKIKMIYHIIKEDAINNTHASIILNEIHVFANKHSHCVFEPGEITKKVLENITSCIMDTHELPENVTCFEIKQLAKKYLEV